MGIVAANGVGTLPKYCLAISGGLLLAAIVMNLIRVRACPLLLARFSLERWLESLPLWPRHCVSSAMPLGSGTSGLAGEERRHQG